MRWRIWALGLIGAVSLALAGCVTAMLPAVRLDPNLGPAAPPPLLGAFGSDPPVETREDWEARRVPLLRQALAAQVYGAYPPMTAPRVLSRDEIDYAPLRDSARIEQWSVAVTDDPNPLRFNMVLVLPRRAEGPVPIIVMENFCGNPAAFHNAPEEIVWPLTPILDLCKSTLAAPLLEMVFGRHISIPPYDMILARGYGLAMFYAGDVVGDEPVSARAGLARLYGDEAANAGAIAVWASLYSRAVDVLATDQRIDAERIAVWGHSRNGKAALLAAALDPRIAAVIAHQSGRGGASLSSGAEGETIAKMMEAYPYWFPPAFANAPSSPAMDQHQLLALIAPRPVLLGNARRDAWADPHGAWRAAQAADPAYRLYGVPGFTQDQMREPDLHAKLAYFTRGGLHGVHTEDWRVFLDFLDAQWRTADPP